MNSSPLYRAQLLIQQNRFELAERELRRFLAEEPDYAEGHSLLAICVSDNASRYDEASRIAEHAVGLEPDSPYSHFVLSIIRQKRRHFEEAYESIQEAIRLDPYEADYFAQVATIQINLSKWQDSLQAAEQGLAIDPDHMGCINLRSIALERLGRVDDARQSTSEALRRDPDDAMAHISAGWNALSNSDYVKAQESFREALRLEPDNPMAREGMLDALRSRHLLFRLMHRFYSWITRFSQGNQAKIIIGLWLVHMILSRLGRAFPAIDPFVTPISMLYLSFVLLSWVAKPLFDTVLRFNFFGRTLLSIREIWTSNFIAMCFCGAITGGLVGWFAVHPIVGVWALLYWGFMVIPIVATFHQPTATRQALMGVLAGLTALALPAGILIGYLAQSIDMILFSMMIFIGGIIAVQVLNMILSVKRVRY
jgi:tetratricopeptide (TPR) repeat protein